MEEIIIHCDGGARGNPGPGASAFVVEKKGKIIFKTAKLIGEVTNNVAEYKAVLFALEWLKGNPEKITEENINFVLDSELVAKQLSGEFKIKNENLRNLYFSVKKIEESLDKTFSYNNVSRSKNKLADFLVNQELDRNSFT